MSPVETTHGQRRRFYSTKTFRLICMLSLTFGYFIVEIVVGNITNSVALVADAFHMLSDVIALLIALLAVRISKRRSDINTYGWVRAEIVGANINTVFLIALCLTIIFDAIKRFIQPEPIINVNLLLIVGSIGLGINIIGLFLFQGFHGHSHGGGTSHGHSHHGHSHDEHKPSKANQNVSKETIVSMGNDETEMNEIDQSGELFGTTTEFKRYSSRALEEAIADCATHAHEHEHEHSHGHSHDEPSKTATPPVETKRKKDASMNMHGVFLHVLADALGSVVVIISALLIKFVPHDPDDHKHWTIYIDPTLSVIIVIVITISTIPLFKETSLILLQTVPKHIEVKVLKRELLEEIPEIDSIHDLHVWRLTGEKTIASAHINRNSLSNYMAVADRVKKFFHSHGIHSTTIQYEIDGNYRPSISNNNHESQLPLAGDCLLRCQDEACDTQACCTKKSMRSHTVISGNGNATDTGRQTNVDIDQNSTHSHNFTSVDDEKF